MFHTIKMITSGDAGHALPDQAKNDMQLVWNVLSAKAVSSEEQERVADLLLCEAAQGYVMAPFALSLVANLH